ncbi:MAG TPA: NAD(P)-dependent oxidoreductase [Cyanobacteria bacterium UBA8803]|nr:NAD(P)-dependent oxidoreductase [Cyanobacteria bacterium UBA9273]HBL57188.1 NAD(P)-dependent oxidoreductase [Cyanobacteria bacterium UBA8803]
MTSREPTASECVLVAGATGGVGQLTVAKLLEKSFLVRVLTRSAAKVEQMFDRRVEIAVGDIRQPATLPPAVQDVSYIICCTGSTAFPSQKWDFDNADEAKGLGSLIQWAKIYLDTQYRQAHARNSPEQVDAQGVTNLVNAAPKNLKRFIFVSSCGILRKDKPPFSILNAFGVLDAKQKGEEAIISSGLPYTIIRPGRLIDGPYTSSDLNTLLQAKTEGKLGVVVGSGDTLVGDTSRIDVASACVECIDNPVTEGKVFEIVNTGQRPSEIDWRVLFSNLG